MQLKNMSEKELKALKAKVCNEKLEDDIEAELISRRD